MCNRVPRFSIPQIPVPLLTAQPVRPNACVHHLRVACPVCFLCTNCQTHFSHPHFRCSGRRCCQNQVVCVSDRNQHKVGQAPRQISNFPALDQVSQYQLHDHCENDQRLWCTLGKSTAHLFFVRRCRTQARLPAASTPDCCNQSHRERARALWSQSLETCLMFHMVGCLLRAAAPPQFLSANLETALPPSTRRQPSICVCLRHKRSLNTNEPQLRE